MKTEKELVAITPADMFDMIEDFADGLMDYVNPTTEERKEICNVAGEIMKVLRNYNVERRLTIIMMLENAVAMYRTAQQEQSSCSNRLLN